MTDSPPDTPPDTPPPARFGLNPGRILLLLFGALALTYIIGGTLMGGISNYNDLRNARDAALLSAEPTEP